MPCDERLLCQTTPFANGCKHINACFILLHAHKHWFGLRSNQGNILSSWFLLSTRRVQQLQIDERLTRRAFWLQARHDAHTKAAGCKSVARQSSTSRHYRQQSMRRQFFFKTLHEFCFNVQLLRLFSASPLIFNSQRLSRCRETTRSPALSWAVFARVASVWHASGRCERTFQKYSTAIAFAVSAAATWSISDWCRRIQLACNGQTRNTATIYS